MFMLARSGAEHIIVVFLFMVLCLLESVVAGYYKALCDAEPAMPATIAL
jgi:hypothetical protein